MNLRIKIPDHRKKNALWRLYRELSRVLRRTVGDFGPKLVYGGPTHHGVIVEVIDGKKNPSYCFMPNGRSRRLDGWNERRYYTTWDEAINPLLSDSFAAVCFVRSQAEDVFSHFSDLHRVWNNLGVSSRPRHLARQRRAA